MIKQQLQAFWDESRTWIQELKLGWEILDLTPYQDFDHYIKSMRAKQRWKVKRAAREVQAAEITLQEQKLNLKQRLHAMGMVAHHAWSLNQSWFYKVFVVWLEIVIILFNPNTYGWYHSDSNRIVALTSCIHRKDQVHIIVFAQWPQQKNWLWWHCIACMIAYALDRCQAKQIYMGLNYRKLKQRSWGSYSQYQHVSKQDSFKQGSSKQGSSKHDL